MLDQARSILDQVEINFEPILLVQLSFVQLRTKIDMSYKSSLRQAQAAQIVRHPCSHLEVCPG